MKLNNLIRRFQNLLRNQSFKDGVWFFLLNSVLVFGISSKYFSLLFREVADAHPVYSVLACVSHFFALAFLPFVVLYLPIAVVAGWRKVGKWLSIIVSVVALIILTIDAYVFSLYRFHLNSYVIEQVFGPAAGQVFEFSWAQYLMVVGVLVLVFLIEYLLFLAAQCLAKRNFRMLFACLGGLWVFSFVSVQVVRTMGLLRQDRSVLAVERYFPMVAPVGKINAVDSDGVRCEVRDQGYRYNYPRTAVRLNHPQQPLNLLVIVFDSWRASTLDSVCAPNIYEFSQIAQRYEKHYSGSNGTRGGVFSIFYGLPGCYFRDFNAQGIEPVLLQSLSEEGYDVRLFPSSSLRNPPLDKNAFVRYSSQCDPAEGMNAWQRDDHLAKSFMDYVAERDTSVPFFSFLFFDSLHSMIKPEGYSGKFQPSWDVAHYERLGLDADPTEFLNLYKNMVCYLDSLVGDVLDDLKRRGLLDHTIVVLTGDHSQEFDDNHHGFWGHNGNYSAAQMHVPLVYYKPKNQPLVSGRWTSHYDLVPTLMRDLFQVENPPLDYSIGHYLDDEASLRDYLLVDSYIGVGVVDSVGNISNVHYDGTCQLTDSSLNENLTDSVPAILWRKAMADVQSFAR